MNEADLLLVLGASFSNHTGIYAGHPIIQVDFDPMQLGKFHAGRRAGVGRGRRRASSACASELPERRDATTRRRSSPSAGRSGARRRRSRAADDRGARRQLRLGVRGDGAPDPRRRGDRRRRRQPRLLVRALLRVQAPHGADVRLPRLDRLRLPGGDGRLGRGAATGRSSPSPATAASRQYMAELTTAVKHGMNITHVLLNNGQLGKITKEQRAGEWDVWQTSLHNPDFSAFARNCGALGIRVTDARRARRRARRRRRPRRPGDGRGRSPTPTSSEASALPVAERLEQAGDLRPALEARARAGQRDRRAHLLEVARRSPGTRRRARRSARARRAPARPRGSP